MKTILLWLWQAPQNIIGAVIYHLYDGKKIECGKNVHCKVSSEMRGGITLGDYIIVDDPRVIEHELGHVKQSRMLGPLYLIVIGLPSLLHAALHECNNYYHFYTEKWAEKLKKFKLKW